MPTQIKVHQSNLRLKQLEKKQSLQRHNGHETLNNIDLKIPPGSLLLLFIINSHQVTSINRS